jgi:putative two-component system response regulator
MRLLITDDDPIALEMLKEFLSDAGHEVICAEDGQQALELLQKEEFQILITDWEMPRLNGIELCKEIRKGGIANSGYLYVILLTSHGSVGERVQGLSAGADDFITKPFEPQELLARMASADRILSMETRDIAIFALAKLAESRDPETGAHLERVMNYARLIAQHLPSTGHYVDQVDAEFIRLVYSTSPLHDIGKVGVPDSVLMKPGKLTAEEYAIMKTHAAIGAETLEAALHKFPHAKFLRIARDIAVSHHERWDGKGYPNGLAGEKIPLCGRIVALADVYDALTSKRCYKAAMTHEEAKAIIIKDSGTHFDPHIVQAFLATEAQFVTIRERYAEPEPEPQPALLAA